MLLIILVVQPLEAIVPTTSGGFDGRLIIKQSGAVSRFEGRGVLRLIASKVANAFD